MFLIGSAIRAVNLQNERRLLSKKLKIFCICLLLQD